MLDKLKADFDAIIELVNKTPAALQEMAFQMILEQWFSANTAARPGSADPARLLGQGAPAMQAGVPEAVKPFLTANAITTDILEKVFHPPRPGPQLLGSTDLSRSRLRSCVPRPMPSTRSWISAGDDSFSWDWESSGLPPWPFRNPHSPRESGSLPWRRCRILESRRFARACASLATLRANRFRRTGARRTDMLTVCPPSPTRWYA